MPIVATHVVWTTYMTWPPGDPRGHWSPLLDLHGNILDRGGKLHSGDPITYKLAVQAASESPKVLDDDEVICVADTIGRLVKTIADPTSAHPWAYAAAIEPTHVHLLLGPMTEEISKCVGRIKGMSSSAVLALGNESRNRVWTAGYWKVFIEDLQRLENVKCYIDAHNIRRRRPANPYAWIVPFDR